MEKRQFGRTGHMSSVAIFGGAALQPRSSQDEADRALHLAVEFGVNHLDVAASYGMGMAEIRMGPWLESRRDQFFVGSKTGMRDADGAWVELNRSLALLRTEQLDLFQIHAVTTFDELDLATGPGGALEALKEARDQGLIKYIGITGHGWEVPAIHTEALNRFDFDSVLFPINPRMYSNPDYRAQSETLLSICRERNVAVMAIKSVAKGPWKDRNIATHSTWYEPFTIEERIQEGVNFALSQPGVSGIPIAGDVSLQPLVLQAADHFQPLTSAAQEALIEKWSALEPIFA